MSTQPYQIENAQAGDFLAFEHDTGLKSFMIFHAIQPHYNPYTELRRLQKEGFIWEAGKQNLRKMNILERVFKLLNFNNFVWH